MIKDTLLVVSDIHGALDGAMIVKDAYEYHKPSAILCLGDVLYHGPRNDLPESYAPKKVIEVMNGLKDVITAVRGNCEAEVDQMVLDFECMADYKVLESGGHAIFMSHGHVYGPKKLPQLNADDIFLSGHTHIPTAVKANGVYMLNPGSVSIPKENHPCTYGLLDPSGFTVFTADHKPYMHIDIE